ncbi:MAG: Na+/H+ antiporter subunit E [Bacillota bacterium]|nr:Na+/H+ antiporter subunit E [Bacillota bacterium]
MLRVFPGRHAASFLGLLLFWFALGGAWDLQHLVLGAAVVLVALVVRWRVAPGPSHETRPLGRPMAARLGAPFRVLAYLAFLMVEVVKANIQVALIVLDPKLPVSPVFMAYRPHLSSDWGRVLLANSITLTPGTLTVEMDRDGFLVHTLTRSAAATLPEWAAEWRVRGLEKAFGGGADDA